MGGTLLLRSYLFLLRKHPVLVAGVVAAVVGAGWLFSHGQEPVYMATAIVQIKPRPATWLSSGDLWIDEDRKFISDQVYRIRRDTLLARKVAERVRGWAEGETLPEALAGGTTPEEFRRLVGDLGPEGVAGRVTVTAVPETSYYQIGIRGGEVPLIVALANAYAEEIVDLFREENVRAVRNQVENWEKEWQERRDFTQGRLTALRQDLAKLQAENPRIDFLRRDNPAQQQYAALQEVLFAAREEHERLLERRLAIRAVLDAVGLRLKAAEGGAGRIFRLLPPRAGEAAADPRLSAPVQSLPEVDRDAGVRRAREQVRSLEEVDASLAAGTMALREGAAERVALRQRIENQHLQLAEATEAALAGLARSVEESAARVERLEARAAELDAAAREAAVALAGAEVIQRRIEDLRREIDSYDNRLAEAARLRKSTIEAGVGAQNLVMRIQDASVASAAQIAPDLARIWLFTGIAALLAVAAVLYLLQISDDTVKCREDFDRLLRGLPFLGVVPAMKDDRGGEFQLEAVRGRTGTPVVESVRALRTTLQFSGNGSPVRTILLTSSGPKEGKTTLSANLAASFAQGGQRTLLVDADLRRARIHRAVGVENRAGLSTVLAGKATLEEAAVDCPEVPGLRILAAGPLPPHPAELLSSERTRALFEEAARTYDRVVVDSPPIVTVTDPCILAQHLDAVLLVIAHGRTSVRLVRRAREALETVGAKVHGAVVNNTALGRGFAGASYYGYDYRYYTYGTPPESNGKG